jgi:hypothetical protein
VFHIGVQAKIIFDSCLFNGGDLELLYLNDYLYDVKKKKKYLLVCTIFFWEFLADDVFGGAGCMRLSKIRNSFRQKRLKSRFASNETPVQIADAAASGYDIWILHRWELKKRKIALKIADGGNITRASAIRLVIIM